jgi:CPA2 family monovalent cation:H+ antiporter-2
VVVRDAMPAAGLPLSELQLESTYGVTVLAIRRDGSTHTDVPDDFLLQPGDRLILLGSADCFTSCLPLFRPAEPVPETGAADPSG